MAVRVGVRAADFLCESDADKCWLTTAPILAPADYPVVLDIAEACANVAQGTIREVCFALAPTWEELYANDLTRPLPPSIDDVSNSDNTQGTELYLTGTLAHAVAMLGPSFGAVMRSAERLDSSSAVFLRRLIREAVRTGFELLIDSRPSYFKARYRELEFELIQPRPALRRKRRMAGETALVLALCPQGIPADVLRRMGCEVPSEADLVIGPDQKFWAAATPAERRAVWSKTAPRKRAEVHGRIFDAWPPDGWGYLRRAPHARRSGDPERMLSVHRSYVLGIGSIGSDFLYKHYAGLTRMIKTAPLRDSAYQILLCAGRLAPRVRVNGGLPAASRHHMRALKLCEDPATRAMLHYEIANSFTLRRTSDGYAAARRWYAKGYREVERIPAEEARLREQIRLHNGLALVEYHESNNQAAMRLEQEAAQLSDSVDRQFPQVSGWAKPLLNFNTAKLFANRFSDLDRALGLLQENTQSESPLTRDMAVLEMARLHWSRREFWGVASMLGKLYANSVSCILDERQEIEGRLMLCVSLATLGLKEQLADSLPPLQYLADVAGSSMAREITTSLATLLYSGKTEVVDRLQTAAAP